MDADKKNQSERALLEMLKHQREKAFDKIYKDVFPGVSGYIRNNSGSKEDARDVFHEAIIILYEKVLDDNLTITTTVGGFIMGISRNLWRQKLAKKGRVTIEVTEDMLVEAPMEILQEAGDSKSLGNYLEMLGEKCSTLLISFYYNKSDMTTIAMEYNYSNAHTASVQKFKCLERLKKLIPTNYSSNR